MRAWRVSSAADERIVEADDAGGAYLAFVATVYASDHAMANRYPVRLIEMVSQKPVARLPEMPAGVTKTPCTNKACALWLGHSGCCSVNGG